MEEKKLEQNEIEAMENSEIATAEENSEVVADQAEKNLEVVEPVETVDENKQTPEDEPEAEQTAAPVEDFKKRACEKLRDEQKKADNKQFAEPVINYLLKRCWEDNGLAQDVMQEHKTWKKCFDYIYSQARKQAKGNTAAVRDDVVYEWAEDYYHKDDKAEEEKKAKEAAERKKKAEANKKKAAEKKVAEKDKPKEAEKPAEPPKPKKNPKEMDGQMDLFSMMGM